LLKNFFILTFLLTSCSVHLKEGDLLFQKVQCGSFCEAIEKVTPDYKGKHYSHVGIIIKKNNNLTVLEAISKGVCLTDIDTFFARSGYKDIMIGRITCNYKKFNFNELNQYIGKPYDSVFDINNSAYYCSELVYLIYKDCSGKNLFKLSPMTFKDPETGTFFTPWVEYFSSMNVDIPEGKPGINPGAIMNSKCLKVFSFEKVCCKHRLPKF